MIKKIVFASLLLLLLLLPCPLIFAHKVNLYVYTEGERICVRAYFRSGVPAKDSIVEAFAPDGKKIVSLRTNEEGECSFTVPFRADILIKLSAGEGHISEYVLKKEELPPSLPPYGETAMPTEPTVVKGNQLKESPKETNSLGLQEFEQIVERVVERKTEPLKKMLLEIKEKESALFEKIIAGIGLIVGLFGIYLFVKVKLNKEK
ncbi:MAG: hypothetical protein N2234_02935 [Planctomycetota bacterium]|nr:hypothetical protein [Planctomycetota bacterium]